MGFQPSTNQTASRTPVHPEPGTIEPTSDGGECDADMPPWHTAPLQGIIGSSSRDIELP
jgi:hypothetical protein